LGGNTNVFKLEGIEDVENVKPIKNYIGKYTLGVVF